MESLARKVGLWLMSALYVMAGVMHFVRPDFYVPMMPPYLPWHLWLIYFSGLAEIVCGVGVLLPQTRSHAAWATIALLIAVFPANIHIAVNNVPVFGALEGAGMWNWVRLPLQFLLIAWAWAYTGKRSDDVQGLLTEFQCVFKPRLLERLDEVLQSERLAEVVRDLRDDRAASLLDIGIRYQVVSESKSDDQCLRRGWLDPEEGWWRAFPAIEPILRRSLLRAGETSLKHKLPIESYWVVAGETLRVATCKGKNQITLLLISPNPPITEGVRWPPAAPEIVVLGADPKSATTD